MRNFLKKWYGKVLSGLLILVVLVSAAGTWAVVNPWPQHSGNLSVAGLTAPVTVVRDARGVAQIYAENEHDLFFAQGYVTAQDRLWQIYFNKMFISGRLSEFAGNKTLDSDRRTRIWGLERIAKESYPKLDPETQTILKDYADGINAYVDTHRNNLPLEFAITGLQIEPYTPVDGLLWGNFMALHQALNWGYELFRAEVVAKLGEKAAEDLLPPVLKEAPIIVPPGDYPWMTAAQDYAKTLGLPRSQGNISTIPPEVNNYAWLRDISMEPPAYDPMNDLNFGWGSGAWVIDGKHTTTGKPILASDAHLNLAAPSFWYEIGLHGGRFDVSGFSFAGVPLVALGHNNKIAWGFTLMNPDVVDLYMEKLDDKDNPTKYEYKGEWYDLKKVQETIKVKGQEPVNLDIYFTRHGAIANDLMALTDNVEKAWPQTRSASIWSGDEAIALSWPVYDGNTVLDAAVKLDLAQNWNQFRAAVSTWQSLSLDFVYADVDGNIGFQAAGTVPIRNPKHSGLVPVPGWTGEYEHSGFVPGEMMPGFLNPEKGFIAIANNKVVSDEYPFSFTKDIYHEGYRIMRITDMINEKLDAGKLLSMEDMHTFQMDTYSYPAREMRPYLLDTVKPENDSQTKALDYVKNWDLRFETDRIGAAVYNVWYQFMVKNTFSDELIKNKIWGWQTPQKAVMALAQVLPDENNPWFDNVTTSQKETRDDIVRSSFTDTMTWLNKNYGSDPGQWAWGNMHKVRIPHPALDSVPFLGQLYGTNTYSFPGDDFTVNLAYSANFSYSNASDTGFWIWVAAQQRQIIDLSNWDAMQAINSTGQNGNLFHSQKEDQTSLWVAGKYYTVPFSRQAAEASAADTLILIPGK